MTTTQAQSPAPAAASSTAQSASLYVGDLAPEVTEPEIHTVFSAVGPLESVRVCRDSATRRSLGYAYVNFYKVEDAERALDTLNFKPIRDRACRIMWSHRDPSLRKSGVGNIFVNHLARSIDNKTLFDTFSVFGNILSAKVATNNKGESLGYAFVHFETAQAATDAIARVDGKVIAESKVSVTAFISKKDRGVDKKTRFTNVYAKNLPLDWNKDKVDQLFSKHGKITSSMFTVDTSDKKRGAFAFVNFAAPEEANAAIQALNNLEVDKDHKLVVVRHQKKAEREKELRQKFETLRQEKARKWANCNLYVKNLPDDWDEAKLRDEFKVFGQISSVRLMLDQESKKSRGFGFVCFATPEEAQKAVQEMNNKRYDDKPLFAGIAQRKEVRRANLDNQRRMYRQGGYNGYPNPQQMGGFPPQQFWGGRQQGPGFYPQGPNMGMGNMGMNMPQGRAWGPMPGWGPRQPFQGGPNGQQQGGGRGRGGQGGQRGGPQMGRGGGGRGQMQQQQGAPQQQFQGNGREHKAQGPANGVQYGENVRNVQARPMQQAPVQSEAPRQEQQIAPGAPLTIKQLAAAPEKQQKQMIGEQLFPRIRGIEPKLAGKITGMLLEMDNGELIHLLESQEALLEKVLEAKDVLEGHEQAANQDDQQDE